MIRRTFEPEILNAAANHPDVLPWIGAEGPVDLGDSVRNVANFALVNDTGGFLLISHSPGIYEVHSMFPPDGRRESIRAMRAGFEYMFTRTDCERVLTQVPDNNPAAAALAKLARFRPMFRRGNTPRGPTSYMGLSVDEWSQDNASLEVEGRWFHETRSEAIKERGLEDHEHPEDISHNRTVGATVKMVRAGNVNKAIEFYNRWARFAGYLPVKLLSDNPVVIDMSEPDHGFVIEVKDGEMEIVLCR